MPLVGVNQAADDIIDIISMDGSNGNDLMANKSGSDNVSLTKRNKAKNENSENETTLAQLGHKKLIICFSGTARVTFNPPHQKFLLHSN